MKQWTYKTPTDAGLYLCNYGDVVTDENINVATLRVNNAGELVDVEYGCKEVSDYPKGYKWLKLDVTELNKLGNAD